MGGSEGRMAVTVKCTFLQAPTSQLSSRLLPASAFGPFPVRATLPAERPSGPLAPANQKPCLTFHCRLWR